MFENVIHQIDSKNAWLLLSASFTEKFWLVFVLTLESAFYQRFHFKPNRKSIYSPKNGSRDFKNSPTLETLTCFYVRISGNLEHFQFRTLSLKQIIWKTKTFFKKLEHGFLFERTKIENVFFPYKTAISEAKVTISRMVVQNGPITKNGVLPVTTLCF